MSTEKIKLVQFLSGSGLVSLPKAEEIAEHFSEKLIARNEFFFKAGRISNEYLFLEEGFMRAFAIDTEGNEVTTGFFSSNQIVMEVSSFFTHTISKENLQALTDCRGWYITYEQLNNLFHGLHEFREFGRSVLVKYLIFLKGRMLSMITETAEERYGRLLATNPEIFQHAPLKTIASYLGITDSSLSRIRKEYSKNNTMETSPLTVIDIRERTGDRNTGYFNEPLTSVNTIPRNTKHHTRPNGNRSVNLTIESADLKTIKLE